MLRQPLIFRGGRVVTHGALIQVFNDFFSNIRENTGIRRCIVGRDTQGRRQLMRDRPNLLPSSTATVTQDSDPRIFHHTDYLPKVRPVASGFEAASV